MVSMVRGIAFALVMGLSAGLVTVHQAAASDGKDGVVLSVDARKVPETFAVATPPTAATVDLTLNTPETVPVSNASKTNTGGDGFSILPVPLPPALLCLLTAFAGIVVLGRRRDRSA